MIKDNRFFVQNKLLKAMISYGTINDDIPYYGISRGKGLGSALLTYFTKKILNIHRLPYCEDRHFTNEFHSIRDEHVSKILNKLDDSTIQEITKELDEIYKFTQHQLSEVDYVTLSRKVHNSTHSNYGDLLYKLKKYSELLEIDSINIEMDILNSFGDDDCYGHFPVNLNVNIPKKNILYSHKFMDKDIVESGEWVVINDSTNGVVNIPISSIIIENEESFKDIKINDNLEHARDFLAQYNRFHLRVHNNLFRTWNKTYRGEVIKPTFKTRLKIAYDSFKNGYIICEKI